MDRRLAGTSRVVAAETLLTGLLLTVRVARYRGWLALPGAKALLAEALVMLALWLAVALWSRSARVQRMLTERAVLLGWIAAALQVLHLVVERFVVVPGRWNGAVTLAFMLATFTCWAAAAYGGGAAVGRTLPASLCRAECSAFVTMAAAVCMGTALELYVSPIPVSEMLFWPEYLRSGWSDVSAFAIANTADSVVSHLVMAPVIAAAMGLVGWAAARAAVGRRKGDYDEG